MYVHIHIHKYIYMYVYIYLCICVILRYSNKVCHAGRGCNYDLWKAAKDGNIEKVEKALQENAEHTFEVVADDLDEDLLSLICIAILIIICCTICLYMSIYKI